MGVKLLGKIKIYDIAKKLNLTSKEVLEMAQKLNIDAKSHMSGVDEEEAKKIEIQLFPSKKTKMDLNIENDIKIVATRLRKKLCRELSYYLLTSPTLKDINNI